MKHSNQAILHFIAELNQRNAEIDAKIAENNKKIEENERLIAQYQAEMMRLKSLQS